MGHFVVRICGRNVDGMMKELGLGREYQRWITDEIRAQGFEIPLFSEEKRVPKGMFEVASHRSRAGWYR